MAAQADRPGARDTRCVGRPEGPRYWVARPVGAWRWLIGPTPGLRCAPPWATVARPRWGWIGVTVRGSRSAAPLGARSAQLSSPRRGRAYDRVMAHGARPVRPARCVAGRQPPRRSLSGWQCLLACGLNTALTLSPPWQRLHAGPVRKVCVGGENHLLPFRQSVNDFCRSIVHQ